MKKNKLLHAIFGLILVSVPLFCATTIIKTARNDKNESAGYTKDTTELNRIVDVINIIENRYVSKEATPSKEELYKGAVAGIINKLNNSSPPAGGFAGCTRPNVFSRFPRGRRRAAPAARRSRRPCLALWAG